MEKMIIQAVLFVILAPFVGGLIAGIDRKITARMQGRKGPSIFQSFYDVSKLFNKQILIVNSLQHMLIWGFLIFIIFTGALFFSGGDLLLVFFALTTASMFLVMAASTTNSPFSSMGAQRQLILMMADEPMLLLAAVGFFLATGSFSVADIVNAPIAPITYLPGIFLGFVFILPIKFGKHPFDLSTSHHAHQELVKGITTEMSGSIYALIEIAHWYETVFILGVVGIFIVNATWWSWIVAVVVVCLVYFFGILLDNVTARVKWQLMIKSVWAVTLIVGAVNVFILNLIK